MATADTTSPTPTPGPACPPIGPAAPLAPIVGGGLLAVPTDQAPASLSEVTVSLASTPAAPPGGTTWWCFQVYPVLPTPAQSGGSTYQGAVAADGDCGPASVRFEWPTGVAYWIVSWFELDSPVPVDAAHPLGVSAAASDQVVQPNGLGWTTPAVPASPVCCSPPSWSESYAPLSGS